VVLGGGNALAIQVVGGWEIVQFRTATLVGDGVWRLTGLLRAQQGTDAEMAVGAAVGSLVVFLDDTLGRASVSSSEVGLPLIWRAGPAGGPAGGPSVSERLVTLRGLHHRPWSPAHVRVRQNATGLGIDWIARSRLDGDIWDREVSADPMRFRVRVLDGAVVVRIWEVEGLGAAYATSAMASDFPGGFGPDMRIGVAQDSVIFGWGSEAIVKVPA
jgi:hypothetical protein